MDYIVHGVPKRQTQLSDFQFQIACKQKISVLMRFKVLIFPFMKHAFAATKQFLLILDPNDSPEFIF